MTYIYRCPKCRRVREIDHGMQEKPDLYCHRCGDRLKRIVTGGGSILFPMSSRKNGVT